MNINNIDLAIKYEKIFKILNLSINEFNKTKIYFFNEYLLFKTEKKNFLYSIGWTSESYLIKSLDYSHLSLTFWNSIYYNIIEENLNDDCISIYFTQIDCTFKFNKIDNLKLLDYFNKYKDIVIQNEYC